LIDVAGHAAETKVTVLVDNVVRGRKLWGEHGLSLLVEAGGRKILFDTGQSGEILVHNSTELGLNLKDVDCIALSHGHYAHMSISSINDVHEFYNMYLIYIPYHSIVFMGKPGTGSSRPAYI
jgi:hypothetical protein